MARNARAIVENALQSLSGGIAVELKFQPWLKKSRN
jgi:hypothetical protein